MICQSDQLAALDNRLAKLYQQARPGSGDTSLRASQLLWLKERNGCAKEQEPRGCVQRVYQQRITELMIRNGELTDTAAVSYRCDGGKYDAMDAVFYSVGIPLPAVVLTRGDQQKIAFQVRSGSGAKYEGSGVSFWEHQGEARGSWDQAAFTCQLQRQ